MDDFTRRQLRALSADFYRAHAAEFEASRAHHAWPGWTRVLAILAKTAGDRSTTGRGGDVLRVLDVGCGNARLAAFLYDALRSGGRGELPRGLDYVGVDANAALLEAARTRLRGACELSSSVSLVEQDFLDPAGSAPTGADGRGSMEVGGRLPAGPFDLVALFGVLHHIPGRALRLELLRAGRERLAAGGLLALTAWQFADRPRFARRRVPWSELPPVLGARIDPDRLEPGDHLLRFGEDPTKPPRYCHQVSDAELEALPAALGLELVDDFRADGAEGDLNRYQILRAPRVDAGPPSLS